MSRRQSNREIAAFLIVGLATFIIVCLLSHDPLDYLGGNGEIRNFCGPVGASLSHHLLVWVGKTGAYAAAGVLGLLGLCLFFRRRVEQWGWKVAGGTLLVLTLASAEGAISDLSGDATHLAGGYYGEYVYSMLLSNLSTLGTWMMLILAAFIAFTISTDATLYPAVARAGALRGAGSRQKAQTLREKLSDPVALVKNFFRGSPARGGRKSRTSKKRASKPRSTPKKKTPPPLKAAEAEEELAEDEEWEYVEADESEELAEDEEWAEDEDEADEGDEEEEEDEEEDEDEEEEEDEDEDEEDEDEDEEEYEDEEEEEYEDDEEEAAAVPERPSAEFKIREPVVVKPSRPSARVSAPVGPYRLPPVDLIDPNPLPENWLDRNALSRTAARIETTLQNFKIDARVVEAQKGPTITQFELSLAAGIKVHKITNLSDDLAMALKAQSIRIIAPIPGKSTVGIEVPNKTRSMVGVRELVEIMRTDPSAYKLPLALGRDTAGNPVIGDLGEMPHLLIAGSTGSGKSVCINSIIISVLMTKTPDQVKLILVDPKMVELAQFEKIPHLLSPVVTDMKKAPAVLNWLVDKMEERYELLAMAGVRHLTSYNELGRERLEERLSGKMDDDEIADVPDTLPYVVVVIDELADLMMTAAKEVETSITRLSQKSRAVGIHVILATQRPSVDVITGLIKANMPSRVAFRVTSRVDSRTIIDRNGADKLLGKGDCLFLPPACSDVERVQGAFMSDKEIREVVQYASKEAEPQYNPELTRFGIDGASDAADEDELFEDAVGIVLGSQRGSVTLLQRQLQVGYTRASRLMELLCERGLVGPFQGSKAREVYYTLEEWEKAKNKKARAEDGDPASAASAVTEAASAVTEGDGDGEGEG